MSAGNGGPATACIAIIIASRMGFALPILGKADRRLRQSDGRP
jgi:hypothetical protein